MIIIRTHTKWLQRNGIISAAANETMSTTGPRAISAAAEVLRVTIFAITKFAFFIVIVSHMFLIKIWESFVQKELYNITYKNQLSCNVIPPQRVLLVMQ